MFNNNNNKNKLSLRLSKSFLIGFTATAEKPAKN